MPTKLITRLAIVVIVAIGFGCGQEAEKAAFRPLAQETSLSEHTKEFEKSVIRVTDGIYTAVGYGLANSILIEGTDGVIIVDTLESQETAASVREAFSAVSSKPIKAIILTHNHVDHIFGTSAFTNDQDIPVFAHATTTDYIDRLLSVLRPIIGTRSMRMFGNFLDDAALVNAGIGPRLNLDAASTIGLVRPTRTFEETLEVEIAGVKIELYFAPGETDDQIFVWLPEKHVLLPGDNFYRAFPNLYTIRGTPYRDVNDWVDSIDRMRRFRPEHLVPSHTRPISGSDKIQSILTDYRDAIQFVHDQTVRGMNMGLTPDQLAETIRLPPHLEASPYLKEFYGTVEWSVRSVFDGYLGWFDGNPTNLFPLSPGAYAERFVELAGGETALTDRSVEAVAEGRHQWALELTDQLLTHNPDNQAALAARVEALTALGEKQSNPNARHYYLTRAAELDQGLVFGEQSKPNPELLRSLPLDGFFKMLRVNLDPVAAQSLDRSVGFVFPDSGEAYTVHVRRGVAEVRPELMENTDITVTVDSNIWKEMLAGTRSPALTVTTKCEIEGSTIDFLKFLALFVPDE